MPEFSAVVALSNLDGTTGFRISGEATYDRSGRSVCAGDVNGDGFDDLIIGAFGADPNGSYSGSTYVVFGKAGGFASTLELSSLDGTTGFQINGEAMHDQSGRSVSSAGDVNGDGFDDLIIGTNVGVSYVVFGKEGGFSPTLELSSLDSTNGFQINGSGGSVSSADDVNGDGLDDLIIGTNSGTSYVVFGKVGGFSSTLELSSLDGTNGFQINGEAAGSTSDRFVSSAGDINGDGFDDLIIGASYAGPNGSNSGVSYVVFGKAGGFASTLELSDLDGTDGFRMNGEAADDQSGASVSAAGDINGDGFADLIVGARYADPNGNASGASYVVFGKAGGFDAALELSSLDGNNGFKIIGKTGNDVSGSSVSSAGDVNGDGFADLIIGSPSADPNGSQSGASFVVFGKATGFGSTLRLSDLDGNNGFQISGKATQDSSGVSVSSAGDVNGDGFDDLFVGAPYADANGNNSGASYVIFGHAPEMAVTRTGTALNQTIHGGAFSDMLDGGGGTDMLIGGAGDDIYVTDGGDTIIEVAGAGTDTVKSSISWVLGSNLENVTLTGSENLEATGDGGDNIIFGNSGANTLSGLDGNDTLNGGTGNDVMTGGAGDDIYVIDNGQDVISELPGEGTDTVRTFITYTLDSDFENLTLLGTAGISGTGNSMDNIITGNSGANTLDGGEGRDTMAGGKGNDIYVVDGKGDAVTELSAGGGDSVRSSVNYTLGSNVENLTLSGKANLRGIGNAAANTLAGNSGDNRLSGLGGSDTLNGGTGKDVITGGLGTDKLTGGTGADIFLFALGDTAASQVKADTILDMTKSDRIDLHLIDANEDKRGNQAFHFIGTHAFSGQAGEVRYEKAGGDSWLYADINGDRKIDFSVFLDDATTLKAEYFML